VPPPSSYFEPINWHRTVCHELGPFLTWPDAQTCRCSSSTAIKITGRDGGFGGGAGHRTPTASVWKVSDPRRVSGVRRSHD
jgi:hypothetical protein